ncbi:4Fe-4S dicluster domain-containing protein [Halobacteria archaeon AArc-dxtr1]|nr:4Fe-4S dicluster domain-containing protein [Halobacteria archaeon AArc-dxtr1]
MSADDESFHPMGENWENELESMLDETEYDTQLGFEMAEDAMAVTKGDLSEAEFHDRYHDAVMEEFGQDDRPTAEALEELEAEDGEGGSIASALEAFEDGDMDRREVMKKMGAGAAFVGLGAWATADDGDRELNVDDNQTAADERDTQWGMVLDLEQCDGCLSCVSACSEENNLDSGVNWMYILDYEDPDEDMNASRGRLIRPCQHCTDAPCEKVCPTTARHTRQSDGLVLTDYDVCIGCRYCQVACPYGVNYFQWDEPDVSQDDIVEHYEEQGMGDHIYDKRGRPVDSRAPRGVMSKCTMCPTRQDGDMGDGMVGTTACQDACPPEAIQFGNMNDETSDPQQYADNPSMGRALRFVAGDLDTEAELDDIDDDERVEVIQAVALLLEFDWDDPPFDPDDTDALDEYRTSRRFEVRQTEIVAMLENSDLDRDDVLDNLDIDEDDDVETEARHILDTFVQDSTGHNAPSPTSTFKLLEEYGTNPNVLYMGDEPGPRAEQVPPEEVQGSVVYENVTFDRADGEEGQLADARKDVTDEDTVDFDYITGGLPL